MRKIDTKFRNITYVFIIIIKLHTYYFFFSKSSGDTGPHCPPLAPPIPTTPYTVFIWAKNLWTLKSLQLYTNCNDLVLRFLKKNLTSYTVKIIYLDTNSRSSSQCGCYAWFPMSSVYVRRNIQEIRSFTKIAEKSFQAIL